MSKLFILSIQISKLFIILFQMSVLQLLTGLLGQHGDTAQQAALLAYLKQGEEAQPYLEVRLVKLLAKVRIQKYYVKLNSRSKPIS